MVLPIVAYGDSVLRKIGAEVPKNYPGLEKLLEDMYETMEKAKGVGLAAPQVSKSLQLFVIDSTRMYEKEEKNEGFREVFINAKMLKELGEEWVYEEGCLSIPGIREDVSRKANIKIRYYDRNFMLQEKEFSGLTARVIQHEYDHTQGKLFLDHLKPLKKSLLKGRLDKISKGIVDVEYKMKFPKKT